MLIVIMSAHALPEMHTGFVRLCMHACMITHMYIEAGMRDNSCMHLHMVCTQAFWEIAHRLI